MIWADAGFVLLQFPNVCAPWIQKGVGNHSDLFMIKKREILERGSRGGVGAICPLCRDCVLITTRTPGCSSHRLLLNAKSPSNGVAGVQT